MRPTGAPGDAGPARSARVGVHAAAQCGADRRRRFTDNLLYAVKTPVLGTPPAGVSGATRCSFTFFQDRGPNHET